MAWIRLLTLAAVIVAVATGCATSPLGRRQLVLYPDTEMDVMGVQAFHQMKERFPISNDAATTRYVRCVARAITDALPGDGSRQVWEVVVFKEDSANAFALPGGKIGVNTGLLEVAVSPDQLAAVIGHEVAHVLARHSNERVSTGFATEIGLVAAQQALSANTSSVAAQQAMAMLGLGAQVGILLPYSRTQESEADLLGLDLMARAGFDPGASIQLWRNMARHAQSKQQGANTGTPPEYLSTHPSHATRISSLQARLPSAQKLHEKARSEGRRTQCSD